MTLEEAAARVDTAMAHAWMVRTFLKHAEEIAENDDFLDVHRTIFDCIRAVEPARQRGDLPEFFHRLRGKLSKLRKAATFFAENYRTVTDHTNWQMAALSLTGVVAQLEGIVAQVPKGMPPAGGAGPT